MKVTNCTFLAKTSLYAQIMSFLIPLVVEVSFLLPKDSRSDFLFQPWHVKSLQVITLVFTTRRTLNKLKISDFFLDLSELRSQGKLSPPNLEVKAHFENCSYACAHNGRIFVVSCPVMTNSLQPRGLQHAGSPCPSPSPSVGPSSCS